MLQDKTRTAQTLARGLMVLDCFQHQGSELGIKELAELLQLPKTIVSRLVTTLTEYGYLIQNMQNKKYTLGLRSYILGVHASPEFGLRQIATPIMERLARETGETISLNVIQMSSLEGVCIASIDSPENIKLTTRIGSVRPLYRGASRKVLLAFADPLLQEQVYHRLENEAEWGVSVQDLRVEMEKIRQDGYAYSEEELDPGAYAVAAPILSSQGKLLAGIAAAGPIYRRTEQTLAQFILLLQSAVHDIEQAL